MFNQIKSDIAIIRERDPAARGWLEIICCYPGFQALSLHRLSHWLWSSELPLKFVARILSQTSRTITGIEIHPGARIGRCIYRPRHGSCNGETAEIGNRCLSPGSNVRWHRERMWQEASDTGRKCCRRSGRKVLGAIVIGENTRIGAGSVVVKDVQENCTVVGVPGE